jgi:predicted flap endonuclease-1-like 5' DNA nuclease
MKSEITASLTIVEGELARLDGLLARVPGADNPAVGVQLRDARHRLSKVADALRQAILDAAIETGAADPAPARAAGSALADRIVMIEAPIRGETFRTKVKLKPVERPAAATAAASATVAGRGGQRPSGDDLTRIRGIDPALVQRLAQHGILSYAAIADWGQEDVRRIGEALGLGRQINRQNWIEQAAVLRAATVSSPPHQSRQHGSAEAPPVPVEALSAIKQPATPTALPAVKEAAVSDRLDLVRGIDAASAAVLHDGGCAHWADVAGWRRADIDRIEAMLGTRGRISKEGWIEQASLLASGRTSAHALRAIRGEFVALVPNPPLEPLPPPQLLRWDTAAPPPPLEPASAVEAADPGPAPHIPASVALEQVLGRGGPERFDTALSQTMAAACADGKTASLNDRVAALERESAALVASDASVSNRSPGPGGADEPTQAVAARQPRNSTLDPADEEFEEVNVSEADVVIVARPIAAQPPRPEHSKSKATAHRGLARLKRSAPLDDIDPASYAGYRDQVEEATVEIVKPGTRTTAAATSETKADGPPDRPKSRLFRGLAQRSR